MAESINIDFYLRNDTGAAITNTGSPLSWGKWQTSPPTQIDSGTTAHFKASGRANSATGTEGSVTYQLPDNLTSITINFDIPYSGANTGGMVMTGSGASMYCANETDSSYTKIVSFPTSGSPTTYWEVATTGSNLCPQSTSLVLNESIAERFGIKATANESIDVVSAAWSIGCGLYDAADLLKAFKGSPVATVTDILEAEAFPPP